MGIDPDTASEQPKHTYILQAGAYFALLAAINTSSYEFVSRGLASNLPASLAILAGDVVYLVGTVSLTWAFCRFVDRRSFRDLGFQTQGWFAKLAAGWGLGLVLQLLIFLTLFLGGWLTVERALWQPVAFFASLVSWTILSFNEELSFRGYIMQRLSKGWGMVVAVIVSSILFAMVHILNPNVQVLGLITTFVAGLLLACGYLVTRSLWLPIGIHIGWNLAEIHLFGFAGSGFLEPSILQSTPIGPDLITGGSYGPEGGLVGLVAPLLGIAFLIVGYQISRKAQTRD